MKKVTVASLFAGGGGWEVGAIMAGCKPVWASELQENIAKAHNEALPGSKVFVGDVTHLDPAKCTPVDILCVSPPCQGYSWARITQKNLEKREDLLVGVEAMRFVSYLRPKVVLFENVPQYAKSEVFKEIVKQLKELGYHVDHRSVLASNYGVPSVRRRLIMRASLQPLPPWPEVERPVPTWNGALADLVPSLPAGKPLAPYHVKSLSLTHPPAGVDLLITGGGGTYFTDANGEKIKQTWYPPERPGPTMTAAAKNMSGFRILLADGKLKRFTPRCSARLQSFPDWYPLPTDTDLAFKVVGNAVPPMLARAMIVSMLPVA